MLGIHRQDLHPALPGQGHDEMPRRNKRLLIGQCDILSARIAAIVGWIPIMPTIAVTVMSASLKDAAPNQAVHAAYDGNIQILHAGAKIPCIGLIRQRGKAHPELPDLLLQLRHIFTSAAQGSDLKIRMMPYHIEGLRSD